MLKQFLQGNYDLVNSWVIGDRQTDVEMARNLGARAILYTSDPGAVTAVTSSYCSLITNNWDDIFDKVAQGIRTAHIERKTGETTIDAELNLDGTGNYKIDTGIGFFDHMISQLARHSGCDLKVHVKGDLEVDEHHTIEDTAIALGEALYQALGDKRGIERYGFALPMDDCQAQVLIDFGGRPWLVWDAVFNREKIGEMPTEMFMHFFKSFSDAARCNLNISARGTNEHHKIEAIFKALARALKMAIRKDVFSNELPTTKGIL
jgi:imidazoleglycerol-phosphate dehydratase/histidinol-phosphatase